MPNAAWKRRVQPGWYPPDAPWLHRGGGGEEEEEEEEG